MCCVRMLRVQLSFARACFASACVRSCVFLYSMLQFRELRRNLCAQVFKDPLIDARSEQPKTYVSIHLRTNRRRQLKGSLWIRSWFRSRGPCRVLLSVPPQSLFRECSFDLLRNPCKELREEHHDFVKSRLANAWIHGSCCWALIPVSFAMSRLFSLALSVAFGLGISLSLPLSLSFSIFLPSCLSLSLPLSLALPLSISIWFSPFSLKKRGNTQKTHE